MLSTLMRLFRTRGERRRQEILTLLAGHPDHAYPLSEICIALQSWSGVIGPDLLILHRRGYISRISDRDGWVYYQIKPRPSSARRRTRRGKKAVSA